MEIQFTEVSCYNCFMNTQADLIMFSYMLEHEWPCSNLSQVYTQKNASYPLVFCFSGFLDAEETWESPEHEQSDTVTEHTFLFLLGFSCLEKKQLSTCLNYATISGNVTKVEILAFALYWSHQSCTR